VLHLAVATDPSWAAYALSHLEDVLIDHAHCEKKAASTALSVVFRYPEREALLVPLARLAREELAHFEDVLARLGERGIAFRHQVPSPYASELMRAVRSSEPDRLLDTLLCMGLIEARSCERLGLLADALADASLAAFYRGLLASEARHHRTYLALAAAVAPAATVEERVAVLAAHEARVLPSRDHLPRLHG
jgi:tRNA-(ms[2]io[6]A)-hydroxylase